MLELLLSLAVLAMLAWLVRRREREAERRGYVAGHYEASQLAARRAQRLNDEETRDVHTTHHHRTAPDTRRARQ